MDKRGALISRLQQQYNQGTDASVLLNTALMLVADLQQSMQEAQTTKGKVSVIMPYKPFDAAITVPAVALQEEHANEPVAEQLIAEEATEQPMAEQKEEEVIATEEPVEDPAAPTAINNLAEEKYNDVLEQVPTLAQQEPKVVFELNDTAQASEPTINDRLKMQAIEAVTKMQGEPIKDLKKAIGINDKYLFMKELFRNDETAYERSIKTINSFNILQEAEYWIQREMKYKQGWDDNNPTVQAFYQLVKRRFA